jgi:peptidoglycan/LPS O-acetylase OafA/YrhL
MHIYVLKYRYNKYLYSCVFVHQSEVTCISGFVITRMLLKWHTSDKLSISKFYSNRLKRLNPAATLVLLLTIIASCTLDVNTDIRRVNTDAFRSALFYACVVVEWLYW